MDSTRVMVTSFVVVTIGGGIGLAYFFWGQPFDGWIPSLACNLFTTGLAVLFVNMIIAGREAAAEKAKGKAEEDQKEAAAREVREKVQQLVRGTSMFGPIYLHEILSGLSHSSGAALAAIDRERENLRSEARGVRYQSLLYGHLLDPDTLYQLNTMQGCMEQLATMPATVTRNDDYHAGLIFLGIRGILQGYVHLEKTFEISVFSPYMTGMPDAAKRIGARLKVDQEHWQEWSDRQGFHTLESTEIEEPRAQP